MTSILRDVTTGGNARFQSLLPPLIIYDVIYTHIMYVHARIYNTLKERYCIAGNF